MVEKYRPAGQIRSFIKWNILCQNIEIMSHKYTSGNKILHTHTHTLTSLHAFTKFLLLHCLLMLSDNLSNWRAISGAEWSSNHLPASQSLPVLITLLPDSHHFFSPCSSLLSWEQEAGYSQGTAGWRACVCVRERKRHRKSALCG